MDGCILHCEMVMSIGEPEEEYLMYLKISPKTHTLKVCSPPRCYWEVVDTLRGRGWQD